jgi:tRNA dimethylallyltransferase
VGPTASGKSALALRAATVLGAEIVSADSRQVYRGLDVGTAKPSAAERGAVPHHCIDVVDPGERYDVARYQRDARAALSEIAARGRPALLVGGSGLYVRAVLDGLELDSLPSEPDLRARLVELATIEGGLALHTRLRELDPEAAARVDARNVRRVVRYLEIATLAGPLSGAQRRGEAVRAVRIALGPPRPWLDAKIDARASAMVRDGVLDEARSLRARGLDPRLPSLTAHGYVHWSAHLAGEIDLETAVARTARDTRAYARRQMTWFRRDADLRWIDPTTDDALPLVLEAVAS